MNLNTQLAQLESAQLVRRLPEEDTSSGLGQGLAYSFKHALTQEAAYQSLLLKTRREIHQRVAQSIEQVYSDRLDEFAMLLSEHYWHGEVWAQAANYAMRAGEGAMHRYALLEALEQYERALLALDKIQVPAEQIIDATLGWIRPAMSFKPYDELLERLAHVEKMAREHNDTRRLAQILHWIADVHFAKGYTARAVPALFENYRLATEIGDERLSIVPSYWMAFFMVDRDPRGALAQFEKVIELARKHHNGEIEAHAIATQAFAHARLGQFAQAQEELRQALEIVQSISSPVKQADVNTLTGFSYLDMGDLEHALEYTQRGAEKAKAADIPECASAGLLGVGFCQLRARALSVAQRTFDQSMRLAESAGSDKLRNQALAGLAVARFASGQREALSEMETALANSQAIDDEYGAAFLAQALGEAYTQLDPPRAEGYLNAALDYYRRTDMRPYLARALQSAAALYDRQGRAADAARDRAEAETLTNELTMARIA